jgi:hypothetical protein
MYGYHHGYAHGAFRPSPYSGHYGNGEQVAIDTAKVTAATAVTGGGTVATLAVTAGAVSAIPVAGWIAAGVLGGAAGVIALVGAIKKGKARRRDAVALAKKLKLPEPNKVPGFIVRALKMKKAKRAKLLARYKRRIARVGKRKNKLFAKARDRRLSRLRWQVRVLEALAKLESGKMSAAEKKAVAFVDKQRTVPASEAVTEANSPAMDLEQADAVEARAEAQEEKSDPPVGEAPLAPGADAAAVPTGLAAVPPWAWALGAVGVVGVIVLATRRGGGKGKKGGE